MNVIDAKRRLLRSRTVRGLRGCRDLALLWGELSRSALVDPQLYAAQRNKGPRDAAQSDPAMPRTRSRGSKSLAAAHWLWEGGSQGRLLGPLLVPPVVVHAGRRGLLRRASGLRRAGFPGQTSHPLFDTEWYVTEHPRAATFAGGPLAHWSVVGRAAGAPTHPLVWPMVDLVALADSAISEPQPTPGDAGPVSDGSEPVSTIVVMPQRWPSGSLLLGGRPGGNTLVVSRDDSALDRVVANSLGHLPGLAVVSIAARAHLDKLAAAGGPDDPVLVVTEPLDLQPSDLTALVAALQADYVDLAGPVLLASDGTVTAAGLTAAGTAVAAGQSPDDVRRGSPPAVAAFPSDLVVARRRLLPGVLAVGANGRISSGHAVLVTEASARRLPGLLYPDLVPDPDSVAPPRALSVWEPAPRLRWAIKSGHPAGSVGLSWGDLHFAQALAQALERQGQLVVVDPLEAWYRPSGRHDDVALVLRGLHRYRPQEGQTSALWVISHPELTREDELAEFDEVFAASTSWSHEHSRQARVVHPLLQCTDATVFTPARAVPEASGPALLFVGNTRGSRRPLIDAALRAGLPLTVVGRGWEELVERSAILAEYVDNAELPALYRSAGIVLNDHWPHMAQQGFLSNRLFDLTAVGAAWISDPATGMDEVFGDVARIATDAASLQLIVESAPNSLPDATVRLGAAERIREQHSFDQRAGRLVETVLPRVRLRTARA
ncbi:MAG: glycosyltransferase [Candidatus Nanopelagicales bacterium]